MDKIFKLFLALSLIEVIATGLIVFYFVKIGLAQTIGIGVSPSVVKFNSPGTYVYEFCFFNQGDTDAEYETINGEVSVQYQKFIVPAGTNFTTCVKKQLLLTVTQPGYFYITAKPATQEQQAGEVSIVRRVGIKVELDYQQTQTTTTTISQTTSGGAGSIQQQTTTTTIKNQTTQTTIKTTTTTNKEVEHIAEVLNKTKNITNTQITQPPSNPSFVIIDIAKMALMIGVIVGVIYLIVYIIQIV
jgi:hypothetical protein